MNVLSGDIGKCRIMMSKSEPVSVNSSAKSRFRAHSLSLKPVDFVQVASQQKNRPVSTAPGHSLPERLPQVCYPYSHLRRSNSCPSVIIKPAELTKDRVCKPDPFSTSEVELLQRLPIQPKQLTQHSLSEPRLGGTFIPEDIPAHPLEVIHSNLGELANYSQSVTFCMEDDGNQSTVTLLVTIQHPSYKSGIF